MGRRRRRVVWTSSFLVVGAIVGTALGAVLYRTLRPTEYIPGEDNPEITRKLAKGLPEEAPSPRFTDVTADAGLAGFVHFVGERTSQLPEDMGSGLAWGDYDNDGDDDLFVVAAGGALDLDPGERAASRLFENLGDGTFAPVSGFPETRVVGMAAAWGDYDADGWQDLIVTGYRSLILYRNDAGERFVRDERFPEPDGYWSGATWGDYDNDRDLDLYVCAYVDYEEDETG
ncbi:MAG: VCBS repeat-containing protein, partial [Acidobacteriota bacterium]|nr:VCBS repeat-containing protein [Acidobacteriota bacterium]